MQRTCHCPGRAFTASSTCAARLPRAPQRRTAARAGGNDPQKASISEDVLARLRAAEEEAAQLRKELAIAQAGKVGQMSCHARVQGGPMVPCQWCRAGCRGVKLVVPWTRPRAGGGGGRGTQP